MDSYFGHLIKRIPNNNPIVLQLARRVATVSFHFVVPTVITNSNGIQGVCLRGLRDENSSAYTCGLQEEQQKDIETSINTGWLIFILRHSVLTTENLRREKIGQQ